MLFGDKVLDLSKPKIMGILNVTPDSFSDGGKFQQLDTALHQAERLLSEGVDILDIGGESTRPGAPEVSLSQELDRVLPVIEAVQQRLDTIISVDTSKAEVMKEAVKLGAALVNDVRALQFEGAIAAAAELNVSVCIMHMQGQPDTMQQMPTYTNIVDDILEFLRHRIQVCEKAGIDKSRIIIDPGFGFGKSLEHNYQLLAELQEFHTLGLPLLVGISRKSMLGNLLDREVDERLAGSITCAAIAAQKGAQILRVHDVKETLDAVKIITKLQEIQE